MSLMIVISWLFAYFYLLVQEKLASKLWKGWVPPRRQRFHYLLPPHHEAFESLVNLHWKCSLRPHSSSQWCSPGSFSPWAPQRFPAHKQQRSGLLSIRGMVKAIFEKWTRIFSCLFLFTIFWAVVNTINCASKILGLQGVNKPPITIVETLDPPVLPVCNTQDVMFFSQGKCMGDVEGMGVAAAPSANGKCKATTICSA